VHGWAFCSSGTIYFSIIIVLLIFNGVMNQLKRNSFTTPHTYTLQSIIISRFSLNLRKTALMPETVASSPSQMSDLQFSRVLGNIGGSLGHDNDEIDHEDEDPVDNGDDVPTHASDIGMEPIGVTQRA